MKKILSDIQSLPAFAQLTSSIEQSRKPIKLALLRSARLPVLSALHQVANRPILLITQKTDRALALADELPIWQPDQSRYFFPEPTSLFYEKQPWGENTIRERLNSLTALAVTQIPGQPKPDTPPIVVAPARAIMALTLPKRDFLKAVRTYKVGGQINLTATIKRWIQIGYQPASTVTTPGQFARRGGIIDIWPPTEPHPARIELFGDEIESIRQFVPGSQRTQNRLQRILVGPSREFILPEEVEDERQYTEFDLPLLHPGSSSILDYLPRDGLVLFDNWQAFVEIVDYFETHAINLREEYLKEGLLSDDHPIPYMTLPEILDAIGHRTTLHLGPSSSETDHDLAYSFTTNPRFGGQLKPFIEYLDDTLKEPDNTIIISRQAARLKDLWEETHTGLSPTFSQGIISDGFSISRPYASDIRVLTDGEIFGWRRPQPRRPQRPQVHSPEASYADFEVNDLVVHIDHGIGYFKGFVTREIGGIQNEYLCLEYAGGDELYVPIHQSDRISRYIGSRGHQPNISRLSGPEWKRVKSKVQKAVEHVAQDLLELYAKRHVSEGFAFNADTPWQKELEASFPYIETEDQLKVLSDVKRDMERPTPMDRLICGDVGYGKTEIALRAAFKAVMGGKQVAILVPTTILAQQHFRTFRQRLAAFPVRVEMLSRFRTPAEQRRIIYDLSIGKVDIVIGTHRLIQPDILFKDLGMVIIDEEQRFGVAHKEYLKKLRTEVDVLTLTATPIPRTLYMALTGIRDISTINTPPEERLPINTHVGPYDPKLVRRGILKELERGGQIFFVHNRVQTIQTFKTQVANLVPEARVGVAHGQMAEKELEKIMRQFTRGDIDVLLSTSIIESGLDIPNANTLIVDRADTFGLAQLYQLRGRVGRGAQRAYAYFFKHRVSPTTEEGALRLETLAENTQLGAGYSIAMRDLEIRGAGDFLGTRQHGQIAAVGLNLYTRLLSQSIQQIKDKGILQEDLLPISAVTYHPIISIDLPLEVSIPVDYIPDKELRLKLYRRIADAHSIEKLASIKLEFGDRFGPIPKPLDNLFFQIQTRTYAEQAGASSVSVEDRKITIRFPEIPEGMPQRQYPNLGPGIRTGKNAIWFSFDGNLNWKEKLHSILKSLSKV
jgi:transcription-repair coupling factor (superfamily II helicase)